MKKLVSVLLVVAALLSMLCVNASAEVAATTAFGDANKDKALDATDALQILQYAVGKKVLPYDEMCYVDVNSDLAVNATDALQVLRRAVGKLAAFPAEDAYAGTVVNITADAMLGTNRVSLQKGGTSIFAFRFNTTEEAFNVRFIHHRSDLLDVQWNDGWMVDAQNIITLNFMAIASVTEPTTVPVKVYYEDHPSIYQIVEVVLVPETTTVPVYSFAPVKDFGAYANTVPSVAKSSLDASGKEIIQVRYSSSDVLANGNSTSCYSNYVDLLTADFGQPAITTSSYGTNNHAYKGTNYTLNVYLMTENGEQYIALDFIIG